MSAVNGDDQDVLELEFIAPAQAAETKRHAFLQADLFYSIKSSVHGFLTDSIYPLPFHGMKHYPYLPTEWKYLDDPSYLDYLQTWNTRTITK